MSLQNLTIEDTDSTFTSGFGIIDRIRLSHPASCGRFHYWLPEGQVTTLQPSARRRQNPARFG